MGNSESVIASRHERKHRSGGRRHTHVSTQEHEHEHRRKRHRHTPSSNSDTSDPRPKQKVRFGTPKTPLTTDDSYMSSRRYANDHSSGGYTRLEYIIDQGHISPGIHRNTADRTRFESNQSFDRPSPLRPATQQRKDTFTRAGSHIPRWIIYDDSEDEYLPKRPSRQSQKRPNQASRHRYSQSD